MCFTVYIFGELLIVFIYTYISKNIIECLFIIINTMIDLIHRIHLVH